MSFISENHESPSVIVKALTDGSQRSIFEVLNLVVVSENPCPANYERDDNGECRESE